MANAPQQYPYENEIRSESPGAQIAHRGAFQGILDLNQAVAALSAKAGTTATAVTAALSSAASSATQNVTVVSGTGGVVGFVNNQTGVTSYSTIQNDNGSLILLSSASAVAVKLNHAVTVPWYATFSNAGTSMTTITPQQGTVNGASTLALPAGTWVTIYFDGTNWWAESPGASIGGVTSIIAGANVTISPAGGTGAVTINAPLSGYSVGNAATPANVVLGPGAGTGATIMLVQGVDASHAVEITTGTTPTASAHIFTFTFGVSRGHIVFPVAQSAAATPFTTFSQYPYAAGGTATAYTLESNTSALAPSTTYLFSIVAP